MNHNYKGALLMMGSTAAFTFNDTIMKSIGGSLPLSQILVIRGCLASLFIFLLARHLGSLRLSLSARDWAMIAARCLAEVGTTYFFLNALMQMPLANASAVLQMLPLTVTLFAALLIDEPVGWPRLMAILAGFCGMLLIVRPGPDGFDSSALLVLAAVACVTARDLITRRMSPVVPSMTVTLMASLSVTGFGLLHSFEQDWQPLAGLHVVTLVAAAGFILTGYLTSVMAMRVGDIAVVSPFRYTGLVWALVLGWIVFGDWPDGLTLLGGAIVVLAGLFTLYRERARALQA